MPTRWQQQLGTMLITARGSESQVALAVRSGVSDRTISLVETGRSKVKPRATTVIRLAIATGQDPSTWLSILGFETNELLVQMLRAQMGMNESEPAMRIRQELHEYVDGALSKSQLRMTVQLRTELKAYIDSALSLIENRIRHLESA